MAERKALQDLVDRGEISQAECSYSYILERALTQHAARANTAEGKAADLAFLADLRKRWQTESPKPMPLASSMGTADIKALVRQELASALQSELPGILQAIADGAGKAAKAPAKKPKR
ncbi:hypothetical protein [Geothrix sp. PMB-07]|uniref:hypothetical protein n=1 Tax=Geothrix sp. PMB-07 TaxID=3068640 RepID=UPI0027423E53|nr:hypothetical protein [Geothrix sp. PMB-07]WLT30638.1 hypothetical protein Q9293_13030 [Geothrix sp. PMB-07]WLT32766.1 hypothetical protein Q9293_05390 [Geothrix sp. PMB-07]